MSRFHHPVFQKIKQRFISPTSGNLSEEELQRWRESVINVFLLLGSTLGLVVLIPSVILSIREELWFVAFFDVALYFWIVFLFFNNRIRFKIRSYSFIFLSYALGVILLIIIGPFGAGSVWLFFFPVITGLLRNLKSAIKAIIITFITLLFLGWYLITPSGQWSIGDSKSISYSLSAWGVILLNFLLLNTITTIAGAVIVRGLQNSLNERKRAQHELEKRNAELAYTNQQLNMEINKREKTQLSLTSSERALKESEIRFIELIHSLPVGYVLIDNAYNLRFVNQTAIDQFGFDKSQLNKRMSLAEMGQIAESEKIILREALEQVFKDRVGNWKRFSVKSDSNQVIPVEAYIGPIVFDGEAIAAQGIIVNISDRIEKENFRIAKEAAETSRKAIVEWVDFIVHELRNPLTALLGFADMGINKLTRLDIEKDLTEIWSETEKMMVPLGIEAAEIHDKIAGLENRYTLTKEDIVTYLDRIQISTERLNGLLTQMLDLSKMEAGKMVFTPVREDLLSIINEAFVELEGTAFHKKIVLRIEKPTFDTNIECDALRMGQVVRNLLSNAIKFTPEGKTVTVYFSNDCVKHDCGSKINGEPALRFSVRDEGCGIPKDQISEIFEKFKQSRKTRMGEGTGLGLPICKQIISAHRGVISAENNEGGGSTFHVALPVNHSPSAKVSEAKIS